MGKYIDFLQKELNAYIEMDSFNFECLIADHGYLAGYFLVTYHQRAKIQR